MSFDIDAAKNQYDELLGQIPVTVTYNGTDYENCTRTQVTLDRLFFDAGKLDTYQFSVFSTRALIDAGPSNDELVTIDGTEYRILAIMKDGPGVGWRLDLGSKYSQD